MVAATTEIEVTQPSGKVKVRRVTPHRLDKAARELGLINVSAKGLSSLSMLGRFVDQLGILSLGNGRLVGTAEIISDAAQRCAKLAETDDLDHETRQGYLELQLRFVSALDENTRLAIEINNAAASRQQAATGPAYKPFLPGAQLNPVNLQVNVNSPEKKEVNVSG